MTISLLAIETSTDACSVALLHHDQLLTRYEVAPRRHTSLILPMCAELLREAQLPIEQISAIAFGCGPGSFTGLRLATGVAQGLAFAHQLPVIPISSLRALAQEAYRQKGATHVLAGFDARMNEIYWGEYVLEDTRLNEPKLMQAISPDRLIKPEQINSKTLSTASIPVAALFPDQLNNPKQINNAHKWVGVGSAWTSYGDILKQQLGDQLEQILPDCYPSAAAVVQCALADFLAAKTVTAAQASPVYLRDKVVKDPIEVKTHQ